MKIVAKTALFLVIFILLSFVVSFVHKDNLTSYTRTLSHEFYEQDNIDILFCGASHVSHGIDPRIADKVFGCVTFNTGTPSQGINGTYAIIKQALETYDVSRIFLEADFAVACKGAFNDKKMGKADFLSGELLRSTRIKNEFILDSSSPSGLLNAYLPIGKDKMMTMNPVKIGKKLKAVIDGSYFDYTYSDPESEYAGKGCVLDYEAIPDGGFYNYYNEPAFLPITDYWKYYIEKITALCSSHNVELVFYSMPCSDFYLHEKGDYDVYYSYLKDYFSSLGYEYYDFNLCNEKYLSLEDHDFSDDNHLNINGIPKYTEVFCKFFTDTIPEKDLFFNSYKDKTDAQPDRCYGLVCIASDDMKSVQIKPITNHVEQSQLSYDIYANTSDESIVLAEKTNDNLVSLPENSSGQLTIMCYVDGFLNNKVSIPYVSF